MRKRRWGAHWLPLWAETATQFWDLVIDIRGSALAWLVPTRRRAIFGRAEGLKIAQLATILNLSPPPMPVAWVADVDRSNVAVLLPSGRPMIVLAPTANWEPKVWPAERFAAVFQELSATLIPDAVAVVLAGPGAAERALAKPLLLALPDAVDLVGKLSLPEAAAVLEQAALFLGNDSGLMHLSAAAGAPTIGIFGPTDARIYRPSGRRAVAVAGRTMEAISEEQVMDAAKQLLA